MPLNPRLLSLLRSRRACDEALTYLSQQTTVQAALDGARLEWLEWAIYNVLPPSALAEYERVTAPAYAEYERVRAAAWAEYERVKAAALAEYERVRAPAYAEYERVRAPALAEYERVRAPAARSTVLAWYEGSYP